MNSLLSVVFKCLVDACSLTIIEVSRERSDAGALDVVVGRPIAHELDQGINTELASGDLFSKSIVRLCDQSANDPDQQIQPLSVVNSFSLRPHGFAGLLQVQGSKCIGSLPFVQTGASDQWPPVAKRLVL